MPKSKLVVIEQNTPQPVSACLANSNFYYTVLYSVDDIRELFTEVKYSEKGSNERKKEEASYMFFYDYMEECQGSMSKLPIIMFALTST